MLTIRERISLSPISDISDRDVSPSICKMSLSSSPTSRSRYSIRFDAPETRRLSLCARYVYWELSTPEYKKPIPQPTPETQRYWDGCNDRPPLRYQPYLPLSFLSVSTVASQLSLASWPSSSRS